MCVLPREVYFELSSRYDEGKGQLHRIMHDEAFTPKKKKKKVYDVVLVSDVVPIIQNRTVLPVL